MGGWRAGYLHQLEAWSTTNQNQEQQEVRFGLEKGKMANPRLQDWKGTPFCVLCENMSFY